MAPGLLVQASNLSPQPDFSAKHGPSTDTHGPCEPPKIRRGAIAKVNLSDFRGSARQKWRFQDVEYMRGTARPGLFSAIAPRKIVTRTAPARESS